MTLPKSLKSLIGTRRFWTDFFRMTEVEEDGYPELEGCAVELPVAGGYGLSLSLDEFLFCHSLDFISPSAKPVEIAYDDQAHPFPDVLRWEELDLICRAIALQDVALPHPGIPLLLLYRFAPICEGDDLDLIASLLDSAWRQRGVFTDTEIQNLIERAKTLDASFQWRYDDSVEGWLLDMDWSVVLANEPYTSRHSENPDFPHASWKRMLAEARQLIERAQGGVGASDAGSVSKRPVPRKRKLRKKYDLDLDIPLLDSRRPLPVAACKMITDTLSCVLGDLNLGAVESSGAEAMATEDGAVGFRVT